MRHTSPRALTGTMLGIALVASLLTTTPANAVADVTATPSTQLPSSYPYQPLLAEPADNPSDASIGRGALPYDEIAPTLNDWMAQSDIISTQVVGQSTLGRDIYMVTLTAPETAEETAKQVQWRDEIKYSSAEAAADEDLSAGYKRPVWFNGNIHGNEWEGTDASMNYIEWVLENQNTAAVQAMLSKYRLYFTVTNNPDGRVLGQRATGLNLDPNRDFVTNITPETTIIRDLTTEIQPIFFIDLHGYTDVLQVEPCGPPHGENYDYDLFIPHAYAAALQIEEDVVQAGIAGNTYRDKVTGLTSTTRTSTSGIKIPYRDTPSGWDDWPPIFTAQYVAYQGAIAYTVELPLGRVSNSVTNAYNSSVDTKVAETVIASTLSYIDKNDSEILDNQIEIFRRGAAGEPLKKISTPVDTGTFDGPTEWAALWDQADANGHDETTGITFPRAYVIPTGSGQRSSTDARYLVDFLRKHGILVSQAEADFTADGTTYEKGSYVIDMHQPLRGLANALLAAGSDISSWVTSMYDISAWSQGYLWGASVDPIGNTTDASLPVSVTSVESADATGSVPETTTYLTFDLAGVDDFRGLNALLAENIPVSLVGTNTVILGNDSASAAAAASVAAEYGVAFTATSGTELAGSAVKSLSSLTIGYTGSQDDLLSLKQLGFADSQLVSVSAAGLQAGTVTLTGVDVLWIGSALTINASTQPLAYAAVSDYVAAGKGVVGRGTSAMNFANTWYDAKITSVSGNSSGNGIVKLDTVDGGVLDALGTEYGFVYPAVSFAVDAAGHGKVEQTYASGNPLVSGHWRQTTSTNGPTYAAGRASVVSSTLDSGAKALVFGTSPVYRVHTRGHFSEVATGLYWAALASGDQVAIPTTTSTALTLPATTSSYGQVVSAVAKVTSATSADRTGTVTIVDGGQTVASGTVNSFGNATVKLPAKLAAGEKQLVARYAPKPGSALTTSASDAVALSIAKASTETRVSLSKSSQTLGDDPALATVEVTFADGSAPVEGTVTILSDGESVATAAVDGGTATVPVPSSLGVGSHLITASFAPSDGANVTGSSSEPVALTVAPAATPAAVPAAVTLSVSPVGKSYGTASRVAVSATSAAGVVSGTVAVTVDGAAYATATLSDGKATVTLSPKLAAGRHAVAVTYLGSAEYASATSQATLTVSKAKTTVKVGKSTTKVKAGGTLKVTVTVTATGSTATVAGKAQVLVKGKTVKTVSLKSTGKATVTVTIPKGSTKSVTITAVYKGTSNLKGAKASTKVAITKTRG